ncbi:MAG TPA: PspC domain-containing protein [Xanthomonadales bacterium]|nr:PspC domain-containing protein [Xanthomonadales bacterium]
MRKDQTFDNIKNALNGRPGQPIVFGVCKALAARFECETWITRLTAIVAGVFFTIPALIGYVLLGLFLKETEARTKGFFSGLGVMAREWTEKCNGSGRRDYHSDGYDGGYR